MNERIRELVGQAKFMAEESLNKQISKNAELDAFAEKFAELIIGECMDIAKRTGDNFGSANPDVLAGGQGAAFCVYQNIKNTFGVEE